MTTTTDWEGAAAAAKDIPRNALSICAFGEMADTILMDNQSWINAPTSSPFQGYLVSFLLGAVRALETIILLLFFGLVGWNVGW